MADVFTTKSTAVGTLGEAFAFEEVQAAARAAIVISNKVTVKTVPRGHKSAKFVKESGSLLAAAAISEGSTDDAQAWTNSSVELTPAIIALNTLVTDLAEFSSFAAMDPAMRAALGRAVADKRDTDVLALASGFSGSAGTTGVALSMANIDTGIYTLDNANAPSGNFGETSDEGGDLLQGKIIVLAPIQVSQLRTALRNSGQSYLFQEKATELLYNDNTKMRGYKGTLAGMPVFESTRVVTSGSDRLGMMFVPSAIGLAHAWAVMIETQRVLEKWSTRVGASTGYAVGELFDAYGFGLLSVNS